MNVSNAANPPANAGFFAKLVRLLGIRLTVLLLLVPVLGLIFAFVVGGYFNHDDGGGGGGDSGACQRHQEIVKKLLSSSDPKKDTSYGLTKVSPQANGTTLITGDVNIGFPPRLLQMVGAESVDDFIAALRTVAKNNLSYTPGVSGYNATIPSDPKRWAPCP